MAVVLMPDPPIEAWLDQLDAQLERSPKFFDGRAVVLDLTALSGEEDRFLPLVQGLAERGIRLVGVEGADVSRFGDAMPPVLGGGRHVSIAPDDPPEPALKEPEPQAARGADTPGMLVTQPVRSGQSVSFPAGDVTVVGSVASGAEIIAGGSIHIYGALRGRAIAGVLGPSGGGTRARIFCRRFEAELVAIDGVYKTADEMDPALQGRPVQAFLEGEHLAITPLD
jgi:septum site-determining protein MinC